MHIVFLIDFPFVQVNILIYDVCIDAVCATVAI